MTPVLKLFFFIFDLFFPITTGYLARTRGWLKQDGADRMIKIAILAIDPLLNCFSFWNLDLGVHLLFLPLIGIAMNILPAIYSWYRAKQKYRDPLEQGSYILSAMLSNRGVVGLITAFIIFGETGYALVAVTMLFSPLFLYLVGFPVAEHYYQVNQVERHKFSLFNLFWNWKQVPMLGVLFGLFLNLLKIQRPQIFGDIFPYLVHINAWLFVMPIGFALEFIQVRFHWLKTFDLFFVKFVLSPIFTIFLIKVVGLQGIEANVLIILSFAPTAINAVITSRLFRLNVHLSLAAFVSTTIAYLVLVLPLLWIWFGA